MRSVTAGAPGTRGHPPVACPAGKEEKMNKALLMALLAAAACGDGTEPEAPYPVTVVVSPETADFAKFGQELRVLPLFWWVAGSCA